MEEKADDNDERNWMIKRRCLSSSYEKRRQDKIKSVSLMNSITNRNLGLEPTDPFWYYWRSVSSSPEMKNVWKEKGKGGLYTCQTLL